jgi:DNA-binding NarL/FixJ family response regulator
LPGGTQKRRRRSRWAVGDINALIVAKDRSEQRWWTRNEQLIKYLDEGKSVREIASLVGRSERQIRVVREQLNDLRAVTEAERYPVPAARSAL